MKKRKSKKESTLQDGKWKTYSDSDVGGWDKTNQSCTKENMKRYVNNRRRQIDKKVRQCWSNPQK